MTDANCKYDDETGDRGKSITPTKRKKDDLTGEDVVNEEKEEKGGGGGGGLAEEGSNWWSVEGINEETNPFDLILVVKTTTVTNDTTSTETETTHADTVDSTSSNPVSPVPGVTSSKAYYKVHADTLCENSQYFHSLLRGSFREEQEHLRQDEDGNTKKKQNTDDCAVVEIELDQLVAPHFKTILYYLYFGKTQLKFVYSRMDDPIDQDDNTDCTVLTHTNAIPIAHAANALLIDGLYGTVQEYFKMSKDTRFCRANYDCWKQASELGLQDIEQQIFQNILHYIVRYCEFDDSDIRLIPNAGARIHMEATKQRIELFNALLSYIDATLTKRQIRELEGRSFGIIAVTMVGTYFDIDSFDDKEIHKSIFDAIFKTQNAIDLFYVRLYIQMNSGWDLKSLGIDTLIDYYELYPSHKTRQQLKLTACEALLVDLIGPFSEMNSDDMECLSKKMVTALPTRVMTILGILRVVKYVAYFVIDEEKDLFKEMYEYEYVPVL